MKHDRERFLSACRVKADYVVIHGNEVAVYTAVERPLHQKGARVFAEWVDEHEIERIAVRSNFVHLRLGPSVEVNQVLEQLEACRNLPLTEGMAEVVDRSNLWGDLPADAGAFIEIRGETCDVFSHLRHPLKNIPRSQFRWVE